MCQCCWSNNLPSVYYLPQRSWGKVIFSQVSVMLFTGGSASVHDGIPPTHPPWTRQAIWTRRPLDQVPYLTPGTPRPGPPDQAPCPPPPTREEHTGRYGQQVGGMHPTGMQSCFFCGYLEKREICTKQKAIHSNWQVQC